MHEAGVEPDWVSGVSIGAINSAIIAGNPPKHRLRQLRAFWDMITERKIWPFTPDGDIFRKARNAHSCFVTSVAGQPGFFAPRFPNPWMSLTGATTATSYYDSGPLRETMLELVDFSLINEQRTRFSVGAVNVLSGNFVYFDNAKEVIEPEHIMASGALPPALPMIKIGTDHFWDGGIVSNTPLQHLLDQDDRLNTLVFQVDLFSARGALPRDIQDVMARHKDIMYSSRTRYTTDVYRRIHNLKLLLAKALAAQCALIMVCTRFGSREIIERGRPIPCCLIMRLRQWEPVCLPQLQLRCLIRVAPCSRCAATAVS
jgi:NTE family protein